MIYNTSLIFKTYIYVRFDKMAIQMFINLLEFQGVPGIPRLYVVYVFLIVDK